MSLCRYWRFIYLFVSKKKKTNNFIKQVFGQQHKKEMHKKNLKCGAVPAEQKYYTFHVTA